MKTRVGLLVLAGLSMVGRDCVGAVPGDQNWDARFGLAPGFNGTVRAFAVVGTNLFVGGDFTRVGELEASGVVHWDGTRWHSLGGGMSAWDGWTPSVRCLATDGTNLYAGGWFTSAGSVAATNVARWDGQRWSPLGAGISAPLGGVAFAGQDGEVLMELLAGVESLLVHDSRLYAGGHFDQAGGLAVTNVAVWDGLQWASLGDGLQGVSSVGFGGDLIFEGTVKAMMLQGTNLFAGGYFRASGTTALTNVARWDGSQWRPLGMGTSADTAEHVSALGRCGDRVLAGGYFRGAGDVATTNLAWWDGVAWSAFPTDAAMKPLGLLSDGAGVIVFGTFTNVGGTASSAIARFDGTNWAGFGSGIVGTLHAATWFGTNLIVGGEFQVAGGKSAGFIAKWDGREWQPLFPGKTGALFGWPSTVTANSNGVYVAGWLVSAGETPVNYVAHFDGCEWKAMDAGLSPGATHLLSSVGTNVYLVEQNSSLPSEAAKVMRWNGHSWFPATPALTHLYGRGGRVTLIAGGQTNLFVAGIFTSAGAESATNLARWDGNQWHSLNFKPIESFDLPGNAIAASGDALFVVERGEGRLVPATNSIRYWDGQNWWNIGSNLVFSSESDWVKQVVCMGSNLFAGGRFVTTSPVCSTNLLRWDGIAWHAVDSPFGANSWITSMTASGTNLYVRGFGSATPTIAKWDGNKWSELGSGLQSSGTAIGGPRGGPGAASDLVAVGRVVYLWGGFTTAGGKPSYQFALWHEFPTVTLEPRGWLPNGHFGLSIVGCAGQTVDCQSSSNLADWVSLGLQTPDADYYEFEDTTPNTNTARFYRTLLVP